MANSTSWPRVGLSRRLVKWDCFAVPGGVWLFLAGLESRASSRLTGSKWPNSRVPAGPGTACICLACWGISRRARRVASCARFRYRRRRCGAAYELGRWRRRTAPDRQQRMISTRPPGGPHRRSGPGRKMSDCSAICRTRSVSIRPPSATAGLGGKPWSSKGTSEIWTSRDYFDSTNSRGDPVCASRLVPCRSIRRPKSSQAYINWQRAIHRHQGAARGSDLAGFLVRLDGDHEHRGGRAWKIAAGVAPCYPSPRFHPEVDQRTGCRPRSILCTPLRDERGRVFAVAQLLNKQDSQAFSTDDVRRFEAFPEPLGRLLLQVLATEATLQAPRPN